MCLVMISITAALRTLSFSTLAKLRYFHRYDTEDIIIIPANHLALTLSGSHHATTELDLGGLQNVSHLS